MIRCFDVVEPYCPERVLRQFGRVQTIPPAPRAVFQGVRGSNAHSYRPMYNYLAGMWEAWGNHVLSEEARSIPVRRPSDTVRGYLDWFTSISHPIVHNPTRRGAFDPHATSDIAYYRVRKFTQ